MAGDSQQLALVAQEPALESGRAPEERTRAQRAAVATRDRDVFTEAGAGAGKTGVLVERYCDCVTEDDLSPEGILAFTFTERAAGELRERVHRELSARARAAAERGEPVLARGIARAAREGERAWITTIHGFCRRLCAAHPVAAGMDPGFRVLDEAEAARLGERAFATALEEAVADGGATVARFAAAFQARRLRGMVQGAHERLRSQGADPVRLPDPGSPARSAKSDEGAGDLSPAERDLADHGLSAFGDLLDAYDRAYERLKAERSGADFEDLELRAVALLRRPGPLRDAWRRRFAHLMVDEFQDTNRVQLALIDCLRGPETRLFCVGDEYQSIYRFRHADLEVFRRRRREAADDPNTEEIPLRGNFRSRPEVLAAVDFVAATLFGPEFLPLEAGLESGAGPAGGRPAAELLVTDDPEPAADDGGGWRSEVIELAPPRGEGNPACVAEARFLAQRLRQLADQGVPRGEMVVLLRAFTHVDAFSEALERAGLAPYVVGGRGYWSQQQVEDALRLCGVIANPLDDEALFGALASPACGASADALWLLRRAARDPEGRPRHIWPTIADWSLPEAMPADDVHRLARFRDTVLDLRAEAPFRALDALIDRAVSAFDYDVSILSLPDGERRMANLRKLMRLAGEYERHEGRDLRGFLDFAQQRTRRDEREGMAAMQVEGRDGVRVMTVHAAKGLEFEVVAVADLGRTLGAGFRHPDVAIGRLPGELGDPAGGRFGMRLPIAAGDSMRLWELVELCEEEQRAEVEESLRLVYVAASRARERLILSGVARRSKLEQDVEASSSATAVEMLLGALLARGWSGDDAEVALEPAPATEGSAASGPPPRLAVRIQAPSPERAAELRRRHPAADPRPAMSSAPAEPVLAEPVRPATAGHLSYSALADYAGCGYRFYVERVLGLVSPSMPIDGDSIDAAEVGPELDERVDPELGPRRRSLAIGNCVHGVLESCARRDWSRPTDQEIGAILAREGIGDDPEARERVEALLDNWLRCGLRSELEEGGARARPEVPFVLELGGAIVRGKIDLLADTADGPIVVDYKTDALRGVDRTELASRYETQRDLYALAVGRARGSRSGRPIRAASCFLEAPERAAVREYDEAELEAASERLERLVAGIRAGDFARTDNPHASLCHGCPAAARLCARPAWRPQWAATG